MFMLYNTHTFHFRLYRYIKKIYADMSSLVHMFRHLIVTLAAREAALCERLLDVFVDTVLVFVDTILLRASQVIGITSYPSFLLMSITFDPRKIEKCELKASEHACKIFFNYSKICVSSFFAKKVQFLPPKHDSRCFRTNSRSVIGRNPSIVIPLLANQDLTPMLASPLCRYLGFALKCC